MTKEELFEMIKNNSHVIDECVISLGDLIEIKINKDSIDIYKFATEEEMSADDYDFDNDYLTTIHF